MNEHTIRICGHRLNWHKPIKSYVLVKLLLVTALMSVPVSAAEAPSYTPLKKASHAPAHPQGFMPADTSVTGQADRHDQRSAGSPSLSPAMVLAMALGLRTATGPMESMQRAVSPSTKDASVSARLSGRDALALEVEKKSRGLSKKENYSRVAAE